MEDEGNFLNKTCHDLGIMCNTDEQRHNNKCQQIEQLMSHLAVTGIGCDGEVKPTIPWLTKDGKQVGGMGAGCLKLSMIFEQTSESSPSVIEFMRTDKGYEGHVFCTFIFEKKGDELIVKLCNNSFFHASDTNTTEVCRHVLDG